MLRLVCCLQVCGLPEPSTERCSPDLQHVMTFSLKSPVKAWTVVFYPFGELSVHHEIVNVLLRFGEFQLSGHDGHHEGSAARTL